MITIDGVEYAEEDLSNEAKIRINRILEIRQEIERLMLKYEELQAAISDHELKVKATLNVPVQPDQTND